LKVVPEGVHLRDCPAAGLDVYEESLHGSVRVVDRQVEVQLSKMKHIFQGCGSGLDADSIGSGIRIRIRNTDPESGSRRAKINHKSRIFFKKFMF
jgi:hypothetical protein